MSSEKIGVLLIDDHVENLVALEALLADPQYQIVTAQTGKEGLKALLEQEFAVILLDVQMPILDGFEVARLVRERDATRHTPIIFLTATKNDVDVIRGYSIGAVDYIFKPVIPEILRSKVSVFIELFKKSREVQRQAAELQAANHELEAFSYSVSHDLQAPLRAIRGFSRILVEDFADQLNEEGRHYLNRIEASAQHMSKLIEDLLAFSRVGRQPVNKGLVDISALARAIINELAKAEVEDRLTVSIAALPSVEADSGLLRQVLFNLIANAIKFSRKQAAPRIEIGGREEAHEYIFYVRDNGAGFDMKYADKLFNVFQRLHTSSEFEGTGVGLAIVQRIVHRHGGRIWAQSKVGEGATFYFSLPK